MKNISGNHIQDENRLSLTPEELDIIVKKYFENRGFTVDNIQYFTSSDKQFDANNIYHIGLVGQLTHYSPIPLDFEITRE